MSYMDRGSGPINNDDNSNDNTSKGNSGNSGYTDYYGPYYTYFSLKTFVEVFIICIILLLMAYVFMYKSTVIDPIETEKKMFIYFYLGMIGILSLGVLSISDSVSKNLKKFTICLCVSMVIMISFFCIKIYFDKTYTNSKFEQMAKDIGEINASLITIPEANAVNIKYKYFVNECLKLYKLFSIKAYMLFFIHSLINIFLIYKSIKEIQKLKTRNKIYKDDLILYDSEENVKY